MPIVVNGEIIDDASIRNEALALRPRLAEAMPGEDPALLEARVREWSRENVIERVLLRQAAQSDPEPISAEALEAALAEAGARTGGQPAEQIAREIEIQLRVQRLIDRVTSRSSRPRHKDVTEYYRQHRNDYYAAEAVHAAHIVKNVDERTGEEAALDAIRGVQEKLRRGEAFESLADQYSDCPGRGGDLGFFSRGQMVDEFEAVVFALHPGEISDIFRSPFGYHIAKIYEKRTAGPLPFEEVRGQIEELLFRQKKERAMEQFLDHLRARATIAGL
jgi:parvulin-like peptidyl-prolyl isomerase